MMDTITIPKPRDEVGRRLKKVIDGRPGDELNCMKVLTFVTTIITNLFDFVPKGEIPLRDYLATLTFAAARGVSLFQVDRMVEHAPSRRSFQRNLFPLFKLGRMVEICNRLLAETAAQVVMFVKGQVTLAIDATEIEFYGNHKINPDVRGGKAKNGTCRFYMYATIFLVLHGKRVTLALEPYYKGEKLVQVTDRLLDHLSPKLNIRHLLMDREFSTAEVMKRLKQRGIAFIAPIKKNPTIKKIIERSKSSQIVPNYVVNGFKGRLYVKACNIAGLRGKHGRDHRVFITHGCMPNMQNIDDIYRRRFGIETSYRIMNSALASTSTLNPSVRFLLITLALTLENIWVLLKYHYTADDLGQRGRRHFDRDALPFEIFLELLLNGMRIIYGMLLSIKLPRPVYWMTLETILDNWDQPQSLAMALRNC